MNIQDQLTALRKAHIAKISQVFYPGAKEAQQSHEHTVGTELVPEEQSINEIWKLINETCEKIRDEIAEALPAKSPWEQVDQMPWETPDEKKYYTWTSDGTGTFTINDNYNTSDNKLRVEPYCQSIGVSYPSVSSGSAYADPRESAISNVTVRPNQEAYI